MLDSVVAKEAIRSWASKGVTSHHPTVTVRFGSGAGAVIQSGRGLDVSKLLVNRPKERQPQGGTEGNKYVHSVGADLFDMQTGDTRCGISARQMDRLTSEQLIGRD